MTEPMTPEAEAAHREPGGGELRELSRIRDAIREEITAGGPPLVLGGRILAIIDKRLIELTNRAAIEREAAHRDSPLRDSLKAMLRSMEEFIAAGSWSWSEDEYRKAIRAWVSGIRAALAAEPIAASSRLDVERLAGAIAGIYEEPVLFAADVIDNASVPGAWGEIAEAIAAIYERLRATPEPEG